MSTRKKVSVVPESPLTRPTYPISDLDAIFGGNINSTAAGPNADPLAQLEAQETNDAIKALRDLQVKKKRLELKRRLDQEQKAIEMEEGENGTWTARKLPNLSAQDMMYLSKQPPEEQQKFIQFYQQVLAMSQTQMPGGQMNPIMAMMMASGGMGRGGSGLSAKDVLEIGNQYAAIFRGAGAGDSDMTKQLLLNLMSSTLPQWQTSAIQNMQMAYQAQIAQLQQNQADPLRDLEYGKKLAESMGYKPTSAGAEVEKLRLDMENTWHVKEFEMKANELQYQHNLGLINQILNNPMVDGLAKFLMRGIPGVGGGGPAALAPQVAALTGGQPAVPSFPGAPPPQAGGKSPLIRYNCPNCNADVIAPTTQTQVTCSQCGATFTVDPQASIRAALGGGQPQ